MSIETSINLGPMINQAFDPNLLKNTCKLGDDLEKILRIYIYIETRLLKKAKYNQKWLEKCQKLQKEFIQLYERIKKKEKECEGKEKNKTQEPFYYITGLGKGNDEIFQRLRTKSYNVPFKFIKNYEISKI